ncbi:MAG: protease inhibitor I42 family protein [Chloroflexota bacterium]
MFPKSLLRLSLLVGLMGIVLLSLSCGGISQEVKLSAEDVDRQVEISKGQTLAITLRSNPTTGYTWEVSEIHEEVLRQVGETEYKADSDLIGSPGVEILRFEALNSGSSTLTLVYHRPWEEGVEPLDTFSIQVTVR